MIIDNILLDKLTAQAKESPKASHEYGPAQFFCGFVAEDVECN